MSVQGFLSERMPRPRRLPRWVTPFNVISGAILITAAVILAVRFAFGLGAVSNVDQHQH